MYPEDRVLVAYIPEPADFETIQREGWYRIPQKHAPKGLYAEYFAFYFGSKFKERKWAIHFYAKQNGYELVKRSDLFPDQGDHPRSDEYYYRVSLSPLEALSEPIVSLRWRRVVFLHTTWDRFKDAREINDLFIEGGEYCDRLYATLKDRGIQAERSFRVDDRGDPYEIPLAVPCRDGLVEVKSQQLPGTPSEVTEMADEIERLARSKGGALSRS